MAFEPKFYRHLDGTCFKSVMTCTNSMTNDLGIVLQNLDKGGYFYYPEFEMHHRIRDKEGNIKFIFTQITAEDAGYVPEEPYKGYTNDPRTKPTAIRTPYPNTFGGNRYVYKG